MALLLNSSHNKSSSTKIPSLDFHRVQHDSSKSSHPSAKYYQPTDISASHISARDDLWEAKRAQLSNKVKANLDEIDELLKKSKKPLFGSPPVKASEFMKHPAPMKQYSQLDSKFDDYLASHGGRKKPNGHTRSLGGGDEIPNYQGNRQLDLAGRVTEKHMGYEKSIYGRQKYPDSSERNINDGYSQYVFDTPSTITKGGDSYRGEVNSILRNDEKSWRERNVELFKQINQAPRLNGWNNPSFGVNILPHLRTMEKRMDRRGEVAEFPDLSKRYRGEDADYGIAQSMRNGLYSKWNGYSARYAAEEAQEYSRTGNNRLEWGYNNPKGKNTENSSREDSLMPPRYGNHGFGFSEEKLSYRAAMDLEKREKQKELLKQSYLDQMERNKLKKEIERQRRMEEEYREYREEEKLRRQRAAMDVSGWDDQQIKPQKKVDKAVEGEDMKRKFRKSRSQPFLRENSRKVVVESEEEGILKTKTKYQPIGVGLEGKYETDEDVKMGYDFEAEMAAMQKEQEEREYKEISKRNEEIMEATVRAMHLMKKTYMLRENNKKLQGELLRTSQQVKEKLENANHEDLAYRVRPFFSKDPFTQRLEEQADIKAIEDKLDIKRIKNVNRKIVRKNKERDPILIKNSIDQINKELVMSTPTDDYPANSDVTYERRSVELDNEGEFVRLSPRLEQQQQQPPKSVSMVSLHESEAGKVFVSLTGNQEMLGSKQGLEDTPKSSVQKKRKANGNNIQDMKAHAELISDRIGSAKNL